MATRKVVVIIVMFFAAEIQSAPLTLPGFHLQNPHLDSSAFMSINEAVEFSNKLIQGDITKAERKFKKEIPIWKIELITNEMSAFEFEISALDKSLIRITAVTGPYDYELNPGSNIISFSQAKKTAEHSTGQKTLKWNLLKNKDKWEYNFWLFIKSGKAQLRIDGETGDVIKPKKKK